MALTYRLHSLAKKELIEAIDWYEKERKGRGAKFFIAYLKSIQLILANPLTFPKDFDEVRKFYVSKFPYTIFYEVFGNELFIYAIFHHKREPDSWKHRGA
jgi:plasmid stabilization system protein ParE